MGSSGVCREVRRVELSRPPPEGRGVPGKVVRAGLPDGQNWNREHQGHRVAQGSCLFCDATAGPAGKGSEKSELHHKTTRSLCKSTETLSCWSLCITQHVPATLAHAGFVLLALFLLHLQRFGPWLSWTTGFSVLSCLWIVWSSGSLFQILWGELTSTILILPLFS